MSQNPSTGARKWIEGAAGTFFLVYGLHYFGYFLRARYYDWLDSLALEEALGHALQYLGHLVFLIVMVLYVLAVRKDRRYLIKFPGNP